MALSGGAGGGGGAKGVRAGGAYVELGTDSGALTRGLAAASGKLRGWASASKAQMAGVGRGLAGALTGGLTAATVAGGAAVAAGLAAATAGVNRASRIGELSKRHGDSAEGFSKLAGAAELSGISLDDFAGVLENLPERIDDAATSGGEAGAAFKRMGIDAKALMALPLTERFAALADGLQNLNDVQRTSTLGKLFSDQGQQLDRLLAGGSRAFRARLGEAGDLGMTTTAEQVQKADAAGRAWAATYGAVRSVIQDVGLALLPNAEGLKVLTRGFTQGVVQLREWVGQAASVAPALAQMAAGRAGLTATLDTFSRTWTGIKDAIAGGSLAAAGRVALAGLNVEFSRGLTAIAEVTETWGNGLLAVVNGIAGGMKRLFLDATQEIKKLLVGMSVAASQLGLSGLGKRLNAAGQGIGAAGQMGAGQIPSVSGLFTGLGAAADERLKAAERELRGAAMVARWKAILGSGSGAAGAGAVPGFVGGAGSTRGLNAGAAGGHSFSSLIGGPSVSATGLLKEIRDAVKATPPQNAKELAKVIPVLTFG